VVKPALVAIRDGDELHSRHLKRIPRIALALDPRADQRQLNVISLAPPTGVAASAWSFVFTPATEEAAAIPAAFTKFLRFNMN
jgi:hypothetical protein